MKARHGIILAKNQIAKSFGVKTGEALWQARQKCPELHIVPPHFDRYLRFSRMAREIYADCSDLRRRFGHYCVGRAVCVSDPTLRNISPKDEHVIHPVGYFKAV